MNIRVGSERRSGSVGIDSVKSWRVRPDPDLTRGRESLRPGDISFYWLTHGRNARGLYEDDSRIPFTLELRSRKEQQVFIERVHGVLQLYRDAFQEDRTMDESGAILKQTILGSCRHARYGRTAIIVTPVRQSQRIEHVWFPETGAPIRR